MSKKSKSCNRKIGVNLPDDLHEWFEAERLKEDRMRGNMVVQLLREAKAAREQIPVDKAVTQ